MIRASDPAWLYAKIAVYILLPLVLLALPADFFDNGRSICLSVLLLNQECFACGLTRSVMHLIHFDFMEAWYHNPLGFIVFPAFAYQWLRWFLADWRKLQQIRNRT